ncbi:TPA: DNA (cytosine-5-)-methyltransferase, partial [Vibrio cholerae]|nr:DNA (cytosine-5-)-methyltransferase [Vibrio cholerae]
MFDVQTEQKNIYYSIEVLADILSQSKATINARVKRGELDKCPKTGKISVHQVDNLPEIQEMLNSPWNE